MRILGLFLVLFLPLADPVYSQEPLSRIAFGSCCHQDKPQPIWETIAAAQPQLFLFIGDQVYGDTQDMAILKAKYRQLGNQPGYQKLLKICPLLAIWDDHDFGQNDAGADYPKKKESQEIFLEFFNVPPDSPRRKREGLYDAQVFGPPDRSVQVILTDTRYFRGPLKKRAKYLPSEGPYEPSSDTTSTLLGEAQWKWLEEQLKVPAKIRLLASTIQVIPEDHHHEKWMNLPHERDRLFKLLRDTGAEGVIILSGDRHLAEISLMDAGLGYPLYDITSSGLNQAFPKWRKQEVNRHRVGTMNFGNNFGMIAIDWDRPDPLIRLQIRDEIGEVVLQQKIPLSLLQPGAVKSKTPPPAQAEKARLASGEVLSPELVKKLLNTKVAVDLPVQNVGASKTGALIFLNSADRNNPDNFTVVIDKKGQASLKEAGIPDPKTHFTGKTIRVTGLLTLFQEKPQIMVSEAGQIEIKR